MLQSCESSRLTGYIGPMDQTIHLASRRTSLYFLLLTTLYNPDLWLGVTSRRTVPGVTKRAMPGLWTLEAGSRSPVSDQEFLIPQSPG